MTSTETETMTEGAAGGNAVPAGRVVAQQLVDGGWLDSLSSVWMRANCS
jgi:hypothetical protein